MILSAPPKRKYTNAAKTNSIFELAYNFINKNYSKDDVIPKKEIINEIVEAINNGTNYQIINNKIQSCTCNNKDYKGFFRTLSKSDSPNLIKGNIFYYHNELRVFPEAPTRDININTGDIKKETFSYFLEMKASYTLNDLVKYITHKQSFKLLVNNTNKLTGGLKYLLRRYNVETLLFTIDTVNIIYSSNNKYLKNIFEIEDYIEDGKRNYNMKKTESVINKTNSIVLKQRTLFDI